jgi:hypothetical protein
MSQGVSRLEHSPMSVSPGGGGSRHMLPNVREEGCPLAHEHALRVASASCIKPVAIATHTDGAPPLHPAQAERHRLSHFP